MTQALVEEGVEVVFVQPHMKHGEPFHLRNGLDIVGTLGIYQENQEYIKDIEKATKKLWRNVTIHKVDTLFAAYDTEESYNDRLQLFKHVEPNPEVRSTTANVTMLETTGGYGPDLMQEVQRFARAAAYIAFTEKFDVIHAHDWMTYPAGMLIKKLSGKPLVTHAHSLEYDRSGLSMNYNVSHMEWLGHTYADEVVAVSQYTKNMIERFYKIPADKITVVHNAVPDEQGHVNPYADFKKNKKEKYVLFMGRVTFQKGPDYFVEAAKLVSEKIPEARFIMAGSGDMLKRMIERVAELRMGSRFHFTGFLRGKEEVTHMYSISDLYVMPSVSEPFGIAPLEAMSLDVPVIISNQSGVSEIVRNVLKVDFWDVKELANKMCEALMYPALNAEMAKNAKDELKNIKWSNAAKLLVDIYNKCVNN